MTSPKNGPAAKRLIQRRSKRSHRTTTPVQQTAPEEQIEPEERDAHPPGSVMHDAFRRFAHRTSELVGSPWAFIGAVLVIAIWAATGPLFGFSDTWQLVINTGTTIITFLMVFLIQNTQNRDARAIHLKLDELLRALENARDSMIDLEDLSDEELARLESEFRHRFKR
ncbi:MAG TPA: low affinity iron permease family protein [Polyangiaceae bacterium]|nr:low affinity iron permease family protein [Polyangiaceae bacterium]